MITRTPDGEGRHYDLNRMIASTAGGDKQAAGTAHFQFKRVRWP